MKSHNEHRYQDTMASKQKAANEKLKDLQLEVVIGIVSGQDVFATFQSASRV